jgi:hypothetical protein
MGIHEHQEIHVWEMKETGTTISYLVSVPWSETRGKGKRHGTALLSKVLEEEGWCFSGGSRSTGCPGYFWHVVGCKEDVSMWCGGVPDSQDATSN